MPIVFVHGVAVRDDTRWKGIETYLRDVIAPEIAPDPEKVAITPAYWGDAGVDIAGISRPRSSLLGMGSTTSSPLPYEQALVSAELQTMLSDLPVGSTTNTVPERLIPSGPRSRLNGGASLRLKDFTSEQLSNLAVTVIQNTLSGSSSIDFEQQARLALAADVVAHEQETFSRLTACADTAEETVLLQQLINERYVQKYSPQLVGMGARNRLNDFSQRLSEVLSRGIALPGFILTRVASEFRRPLNDRVTLFLGDVFTYLRYRKTPEGLPGKIPEKVLDKLVEAGNNQKQRSGEPFIVVSHSMGGQIVYDLVTYFLPKFPQYAGLRIDFWCATASQVGLFTEMDLFLIHPPPGEPIPFPDRRYLGGWWNVWDHNDFISYTTRGIFDDEVDDEAYDSGMSALHAHSGYLQRPSFYRTLASKIRAARSMNWRRP